MPRIIAAPLNECHLQGTPPSLNLINPRTDVCTSHVSVHASTEVVNRWVEENAVKEGNKIHCWLRQYLPRPIYLALRQSMITNDE